MRWKVREVQRGVGVGVTVTKNSTVKRNIRDSSGEKRERRREREP